MLKTYPCDAAASSDCSKVNNANQRDAQEYMVLSYAQNLGNKDNNAVDAVTFEKSWDTGNQKALKSGLSNVTDTAGIPSMLDYMGSFDISGNPSAEVAVIAEANVFNSVASFEFT